VFTPAASVCELNRQILIVSKALMLSIGYPIGFNVVNHGVGNRYAKQMPARLRVDAEPIIVVCRKVSELVRHSYTGVPRLLPGC
jgi:hypothetical protein